MDKIHDSDQTAFLRQALELFENCGLAPGILAEIRKVVPPHRPPTRKAPKVSREQIVLDMKKKLEKEEQELRERKISLDQARRLVTEREQKVMDQATIVSALKMELVEFRQSIVNNPTPEVSEDEDVDATPLGVPVAPPPAVPPAVPPENTPLDFGGADMDEDLIEEANPPATKRKGEFGVIQVPTNRQEFQQWTAGLDRESVREGLLHCQALNEQYEREEHARQVEAMERASASGTVADDEKTKWVTGGLLSIERKTKFEEFEREERFWRRRVFSILIKKKEVRKKGKGKNSVRKAKILKKQFFKKTEVCALAQSCRVKRRLLFLLFLQVPNQLNLDVVCQVPFLIPTFLSLEPPS